MGHIFASQSSGFVLEKTGLAQIFHCFACKDGTKPRRSGLGLYLFSVFTIVPMDVQKYV